MLFLVNEYGLSFICGNQIFDNIENEEDGKNRTQATNFNFPFLDIRLKHDGKRFNPEFHFRGMKDHSTKIMNLFEYALKMRSNGLNFKNSTYFKILT